MSLTLDQKKKKKSTKALKFSEIIVLKEMITIKRAFLFF